MNPLLNHLALPSCAPAGAQVAKQLSWPRLLGMALDAARGERGARPLLGMAAGSSPSDSASNSTLLHMSTAPHPGPFILAGMLYLHSRAVYHRDLKSANLLVCASWQVKVRLLARGLGVLMGR